jgi:predicted DNA-binding protein (UPF0278 family)
MSKEEVIIDFRGPISFETMEELLNQLKTSPAFNELRKPVRKRLYGTVVESIDNIYKYAASNPVDSRGTSRAPLLLVKKKDDVFTISVGNLVLNSLIDSLRSKLDRINQLDNDALKALYEEVINKETGQEDTGAGLGLITMALRTEVDIEYCFEPVDAGYSFFTMKIDINA